MGLAFYGRKKFSNREHILQFLHVYEELPFMLMKNSLWEQKIFHLAVLWVTLLSQKWTKGGKYPFSSIMIQQGTLEPPRSEAKRVSAMPHSSSFPFYLQACLRSTSPWLMAFLRMVERELIEWLVHGTCPANVKNLPLASWSIHRPSLHHLSDYN